ncbi:extracellular matrix protein 14 [Ceratobasidium sp. AG-Ba]|nr:extracellular matrix protein 14 [Ceratobasidium sp. AG-Ba]QRW02744.1 extracellular matrix protein 14 [Ceratobasidium sp. AG-Ba]
MADQTYEDEERVDQFHLIFQTFVKLCEYGGFGALYASLQPADDTISPHQITLLKLLDGYIQTIKGTVNENSGIRDFLVDRLFSDLRKANDWMAIPLDNGQPNEALPQIAANLVLLSQMIASCLMSEQVLWEKSSSAMDKSRPTLDFLRSSQRTYVELIVDALRHLNELLPRIQFGKVKPQLPTSRPNELISPDVPGFQFVKRDLVRLLAILVHDDRSIQNRIRERGGVEVVLSMCAVDDRNPYIREHALFALRNLLHNNTENQDIVKELEPTGRWDESGVLTDLR